MVVKKKRKAKPLLIILIFGAIILFALAGVWITFSSPVDKKNEKPIEVVIPSGTTSRQIGTILKNKKLIRNEFIFNVYIKVYRVGPMKASTYNMTQSMSLDEIVKTLVDGNSYNPNVVKITFREGEWIIDFAKEIAKHTNHTYEDVIETMLNQTDKNLSKYKDKLTKSVHYYITMASLAELEGTNSENKKQIVGVFENRLNIGDSLGSDVTTYYALQHPMTQDLTTAQFATANPYNTRSTTMRGKMPVGPICNPSNESIEAAINPTTSNNYFFVADKYGKIHFTATLAEHNAKIKEIKDSGGWIW